MFGEKKEPIPKISFGELLKDEKDFFENPHDYEHTLETYLPRALVVLDKLNPDGLKEAKGVLSKAVENLATYKRWYPKGETDTLLAEIEKRMSVKS